MNKILNFTLTLILSIALNTQAQQRYATYEKFDNDTFRLVKVENDPMNVLHYTLNNGLQVYLSVNKEKPRVQTYIAVKAGSADDPADHTGLAHYLEHMLFKGTDKFGTHNFKKEKPLLDKIFKFYEDLNKTTDSAERASIYEKIDKASNKAAKFAVANEYDKLVESIGAKGTNAFTSFDKTVYVNNIPSNQLHRWIEIEAERFRKPIFRLFHTELEAVYEEKNRTMDNDPRRVFETVLAELFKKHTYGTQTTIGTIEHLKNPSLEAIQAYYNKNYVPNNMAIIMSGDFDPDHVIKMISKHFFYMESKKVPKRTFSPEYPSMSPTVKEIYGPTAEFVSVAYRLPAADRQKSHLYNRLIDMLLYNGSTGLIDLNLVKKQKVQRASSFVLEMNDHHMFYLSASPKKGQTMEDAKAILMEQINKLKNGDFSEEQMKAILLNNQVDNEKALLNNKHRAGEMLEAFTSNKPWVKYLNEPYETSLITKAKLMDYAKEHLNNDHVVVYKRKGANTSLKKIPKPLITPLEIDRSKVSGFAQDILDEEPDELKPKFYNFKKAIAFDKVNNTDLWYIKNDKNTIFRQTYILEIGKNHNLKVPLAWSYFNLLGTDKYTPAQLEEEFYKLACVLSVRTTDKKTFISISGPQKNYKKAISLVMHKLNNVKVDSRAFNNLTNRILKSRENAKTSRRSIKAGMINYAIYGNDNPFKYKLNTSELAKIGTQELHKIINNVFNYPHKIWYYGPNDIKSVKSVLGNKHPSKTGSLKVGKLKEFVKLKNTENKVFFTHYDMVQAEVNWVKRTTLQDTTLRLKSKIYNQYFGGGMGSIVFQEIRESKALAYSTYAYYKTTKKNKYNSFNAYVGCQADKIHQAIPAMNELINNMPKSEKKFNTTIDALSSGYKTSRTNGMSYFYQYQNMLDNGYNSDPKNWEFKQLSNYTLKDIGNFANKYVANKKTNYTVLASNERVDIKSLEKYGKVTVLKLSDIFID